MASTVGKSYKSEVRFSGDTYINILGVHLKQQLMWYKRPAEDGQIYVRLVSVSHYASLVGCFCIALLYAVLHFLYDGCISNLTQRFFDYPKINTSLCGFESHSCFQDGGIGKRTRFRLWQKRDVAVIGSNPIQPPKIHRKYGACSSAVEHYTFLTLGDTLHLHHQADHLLKLINRLFICINYKQCKGYRLFISLGRSQQILYVL